MLFAEQVFEEGVNVHGAHPSLEVVSLILYYDRYENEIMRQIERSLDMDLYPPPRPSKTVRLPSPILAVLITSHGLCN